MRLLTCLCLCVTCAGAQTFTTILNFNSVGSGLPETGVIVGPDHILYGTSHFLASTEVYSLTPPKHGQGWTYDLLYEWTSPDGGAVLPQPGLTLDTNGVIYGTTVFGGGGTGGYGMVFSLTPPTPPSKTWTETTLYSFTGGGDGSSPTTGVIIGPGGVLYGAAASAGAFGHGTVFSLAPPASPGGSWIETTLHSFTGLDGNDPLAPLIIDSNGVLYGTTEYGGASNKGAVFSLTPPASPGGEWTEAILYNFTGGSDGGLPLAGLVWGAHGTLYGSTSRGGAGKLGVAFILTPPGAVGESWTESVLHSFAGFSPGPLVWGPNGALYGISGSGGAQKAGNVFALTPPKTAGSDWNLMPIHSFPSGFSATGGNYPWVGEILAVGGSGVIYGTTYGGGTYNSGTVFSLVP